MVSPVQACDATCTFCDEPVDAHSIQVGEASFTIDPLSSQGVQAAMISALHGGAVVHTLLAYPAYRTAALDFYRARQQERVQQHSAWAAEFYARQPVFQDRPFWMARAQSPHAAVAPRTSPAHPALAADCRIRLSKDARFIETPALRGDIIAPVLSLTHPALTRPVAYLGDTEVSPLLALIADGQSVQGILECWSRSIPRETGWQILQWVAARGIVEPLSEALAIQVCQKSHLFPYLNGLESKPI